MTARPSEKTLIKIQAVSGLAFATFLVLHLANTMLASAGQESYNAFQRAARWYYQFPLVEALAVFGAALVHMGAGVVRLVRRRRLHRQHPQSASKPPLKARLHRYSGYYLMAVFAGHVIATRIGPVLVGLDVKFSFLTYSLQNWPYYFYPYYGLFFISGALHLAHGAAVALRVLGARVPKAWTAPDAKPFWLSVGAVSAAGLLALLALGGKFFDVDKSAFAQIDAVYEKLLGPRRAPSPAGERAPSLESDRVADAK